MKKIILGVLVLVLAAVGYFFYSTQSSTTKPISTEPKTIVAFGDSLVQGIGASQGKDFVSDLSDKIGTQIINKGVSGETTADGLKRVNDIIDLHPDIVLVLFGGNDAIQQKPVNETFANLSGIISAFQQKGITVVLLGIQGGYINDKYKDHFDDLAKRYKVTYVPNIMSGIIGHEDLMSDQVHPNDTGYAMIADKIFLIIKPLINKE